MSRILARIWRYLGSTIRWRVLWLAHDKFMLGVAGVVIKDQSQVLLLRHRYWKAETWGLPAGYAKKSETLESCIAREVKEETGYLVESQFLLKIVSGYKLRFEAIYMARLAGGELKIDSGELLEARFFPLDQLPKGLLRTHLDFINIAKAKLASDPDSIRENTLMASRP